MKVLGAVTEYNPFHNGHLYHIQASRALTGAQCVVAVMSGNFTQRGEPAIVDKWARTEMALLCGVDLVIELPCIYSMASAEYFAFAAVKLLDSLDVVDYLCFGSESGEVEILAGIADILSEEPEQYKSALREFLSLGNSYPAARSQALISYIEKQYGKDRLHGYQLLKKLDHLPEILKNPNNILGIEYLKALRRLNSSIVPVTIKRAGNEYRSEELTGKLSSASSIRKIISENVWKEAVQIIAPALPSQALAILEREIENGRGPVFPDDYEMLLLSHLRKMSVEETGKLPYMEKGLENRLKLSANNSGSFKELLDSVCTRRYPNARIRRILFSLLSGLKREDFDSFNKNGGPPYLRILGFNDKGRQLLSQVRDNTALPIINKSADFKNSTVQCIRSMLNIEASATDQYVLAFKNVNARKSGSEFTRNVIYV